ncbi:MAG: hypothetical protein O7B81_07490 [Gammaproteobacteria bacterium]|nr:hypothetical protein [Gammaproteobacteria bacterium]
MKPAHDNPAQLDGFPVPGRKPPVRPPREPMTGRYCRIKPLERARHAAVLHEAKSLDPGDFDEAGRQRLRLTDLTRPLLKQVAAA